MPPERPHEIMVACFHTVDADLASRRQPEVLEAARTFVFVKACCSSEADRSALVGTKTYVVERALLTSGRFRVGPFASICRAPIV